MTKPLLPDDPRRFLSRELSWVEFNRRVVEEAANPAHPLLERIRFIAISANNVDEFYMVRIAYLVDLQRRYKGAQLKEAQKNLTKIDAELRRLILFQRAIFSGLLSELARESIIIVPMRELKSADKQWLEKYFQENIFLALTPLVIHRGRPFPFVPNRGVALAVKLRDKKRTSPLDVVVPLPLQLARFIRLPQHTHDATIRFVILEDVIKLFLHYLFPASEIAAISEFRVLRNSEIHITMNENEDFIESFESAVKQRKRGAIIRLTVANNMPRDMRQYLIKQMNVPPERLLIRTGMMRLSDIWQLIINDRPELLFPTYAPRFPERIREYKGDCFAAISHKDILVHHPYESFEVVLEFIRQASADPHVVAIKQTLYRTSKDSPIVKALIEAARAGKSVTVMVELKARFDEEANIRWARDLEQAGAQVVFGFKDLKTHAKITLVIRRENNILKSYTHFGTGNYHPDTARQYTDLSLFTCDDKLGQDAAVAFNFMTGYAKPVAFNKLVIAPTHLRQTLMDLIDGEIASAKAGRPAQIWAKMNALVDPHIIDKLYEASRAGVDIELIVRGPCCLRPGLPRLSDNIHVKSIIGRYLEHSRMVAFGNGQALPSPQAKVFISSADWMPRNLDWRVETLVPIENPTVHQQILNQIFLACLLDTRQSWELQPDGNYTRSANSRFDFSAHEYFMKNPSLSGRGNLKRKILPPRLSYKPKWKEQ